MYGIGSGGGIPSGKIRLIARAWGLFFSYRPTVERKNPLIGRLKFIVFLYMPRRGELFLINYLYRLLVGGPCLELDFNIFSLLFLFTSVPDPAFLKVFDSDSDPLCPKIFWSVHVISRFRIPRLKKKIKILFAFCTYHFRVRLCWIAASLHCSSPGKKLKLRFKLKGQF